MFQWLAVPFAMIDPAVGPLTSEGNITAVDWIGEVKPEDYGLWLDYALLLIFGGIPWQVSSLMQLSLQNPQ